MAARKQSVREPPSAVGRAFARLVFIAIVFAAIAGAILTRPDKRLTDFDQSFYLTIAYDLRHHGTFSNGVFDDVDSTRAVPKPGMFFAPLYPLVIAGVAVVDPRFAATLDCTIEANEKHREIGSCDHHAWPMHVVHAALLTIGVGAVALAAEMIFAGAAIFYLAGVLAAVGVVCEADLFSYLMTESLAFCVYSLFGLALVAALKGGGWRAWALAGLAAGIAALARPPYLLLVPLGLMCLTLSVWLHQARSGMAIMDRLTGILPATVAFVVAAGLVLAPWFARNLVAVGKAGFTEEYGAATMIERLAFNRMTATEFAAAFPYCVPVVGPPVVETIAGNAAHRFLWSEPDSFFHDGRERRDELVEQYGRLDPVIGPLLRTEMARDWWRHLLTTIPLAWCGLWVANLFSLPLLPLFAVALVAAAQRRQALMLYYAAPALVLAVVYALLANQYPRYNLGLIGPIAAASAWMIARVGRRVLKTG